MTPTEPDRDDEASDMSEVARAWRTAPHDDPPAALDAAIRAAARRAVHARPHAAQNRWLRRWSSPIAAAAVVMLAMSALFIAIDERPEIAPAALRDAVPTSVSQAPALPAAKTTTSAEAIDSLALSPPGSSARTDAGHLSAADTVAAANTDAVATNPKAAPAAAPPNVGSDRNRGELQSMAESVRAPAPGFATKAASASVTAGVTALPPPPAADSLTADKGASREETAQSSQASKRMMAKQAAPAAGAAVNRETRRRMAELDADSGNAPRQTPTATTSPVSAPPAPPPDPASWLKRIEEWRLQGKLKEVREELVRFRKQYPNIELPKALAELPAE